MPYLADLISSENLDRLASRAEQAILDIVERREEEAKERGSEFHPSQAYVWNGRSWDDASELAEPILRFIHTKMLAKSHQKGGLPDPYTRIWDGSIAHLLRDLGVPDESSNGLAGAALATFRKYKLAHRPGKGKSRRYWLREWPSDLHIDEVLSRTGRSRMTARDTHRMETRIAEERTKSAQTLKTSYSLSHIPLPEPNPQSVMEYVDKLVSAYNRLEKAYSDTAEALGELTTERDQLREELDRIGGIAEWSGVTSALAKRVRGETTEGGDGDNGEGG